jgi:hypothetical protein
LAARSRISSLLEIEAASKRRGVKDVAWPYSTTTTTTTTTTTATTTSDLPAAYYFKTCP